jgi:glycosyltransferase involved in cell wall biosynthesis
VAVTVEQSWHRVPGGTAASVLELLGALRDRSELDVIGVSARHASPPPATWAVPVPVRPLPLPRAVLYETWHAPGFRFPKVERATGDVDVVHATAVAYPATDAPVVVTVHDLAFLHDRRNATRHGHRFFRRGTELARQHASLVVTPSQVTADECIAAGFARERVRVVPWGVHTQPVSDDAVTRVRASYGIDGRYVLFTGTVEPRKNLGRLLEAYARVDRRDVQLVLAGPEGWNEDIGAALARLDGRVRSLGFVPRDDLLALLAGADLFCYPSVREGFGLPVLEAMAQGTPVVTSSSTATAEVAGDTGVLVDPLDVGQITEAIEQLLDDPEQAQRIGAAGAARAARFTWDAAAAAYADVYAEVASSSPPGSRPRRGA